MILGWGAFGGVVAVVLVVLGVSAGPAVLVGAGGAVCGAVLGCSPRKHIGRAG